MKAVHLLSPTAVSRQLSTVSFIILAQLETTTPSMYLSPSILSNVSNGNVSGATTKSYSGRMRFSSASQPKSIPPCANLSGVGTEQQEHARQIAADRRYQEQTGHSLQEKQHYDNEVKRLHRQIDQMRQVFQSVLNEVVTARRGLSRRSHQDGDILDPNRLAQTITDIKGGITPEAFQRYETVRGRTELNCKTNYFFVFDCSASMSGAPAEAAASCAVIMLEGLAGTERDIRQLEQQQSIDLSDLSVRTSLYTFGDTATCHKPLSSDLNDKQRLDTYAAITAADMGSTADYLALQEIADLPRSQDRQRIIIVATDGASDNPSAAQAAVSQLRRDQNTVVYGVSIGSAAAEQLYAPNAKRINDPKDLPNVLQSFIETTIQT